MIKAVIEERLNQCRLESHPAKTKIVYCKDSGRQGSYLNENLISWDIGFNPGYRKIVMENSL